MADRHYVWRCRSRHHDSWSLRFRSWRYGIWFGCKTSGFLRETAGRWALGVGRWALGVWRLGGWAAGRLGGWAAGRLGDRATERPSVDHLASLGRPGPLHQFATRQVASLPSGAIYFFASILLFRVLSHDVITLFSCHSSPPGDRPHIARTQASTLPQASAIRRSWLPRTSIRASLDLCSRSLT